MRKLGGFCSKISHQIKFRHVSLHSSFFYSLRRKQLEFYVFAHTPRNFSEVGVGISVNEPVKFLCHDHFPWSYAHAWRNSCSSYTIAVCVNAQNWKKIVGGTTFSIKISHSPHAIMHNKRKHLWFHEQVPNCQEAKDESQRATRGGAKNSNSRSTSYLSFSLVLYF